MSAAGSAKGGANTLFGGIDSGSWNTKAVIIGGDCRWLGSAVVRTGADLEGAAGAAFELALRAAGLGREALDAVWATGFGRRSIPFAHGTRTELDCHARGVRHHVQGATTIIDIGGQDAKVIRLDAEGRRISHRMNRKCAAGTGSFLDEMALRLDTSTDRLPELAAKFSEEVELGSFCTVFSGTELLGAIRGGKRPADLARAAYKSVVRRVLEMDVFDGQVAGTGGVVAHHPMVLDLFAQHLGARLIVPPHPQELGAFGAALAARESILNQGLELAPEAADLP